MKVYVDSSALIKRAVAEAESETLEQVLERHVEAADALVSSTLAWIEISRALRARLDGQGQDVFTEAIDDALAGVAERAITPDVVSLARRIEPNVLRSLDAIHLATAVLLDVDAVLTYDERLAMAARHNGLAVSAPA
jgi:predicted nucleic acid-binding protein